MKELKDNIFGKYGFIYKIESNDDEKYYYIGQAIFKKCTSDYEIYKYNKFVEAVNINDTENMSKYFNKIVSISESEANKEDYINLKMQAEEFIDSLNEE